MKISLLWFCFVCCGIANGLIFDHVNEAVKYNYMVVVGVVALILLVVHRIITRRWYKPMKDSDPQHQLVFGLSTGVSCFVGIITLLSYKTNDASLGACVGVGTAFLCFLLAYLKEMKYTSVYWLIFNESLVFFRRLF